MATVRTIKAEVVYTSPTSQHLIAVELPVGSTIEQAILASGILTLFPEIDLATQKVGIFSELKQLDDVVLNGDRVEIYRPLLIDPKVARRVRSKQNRD